MVGRRSVERKTSPRLRGYDYGSTGYYFITICTSERLPRFGSIEKGLMVLNKSGEIVQSAWLELPDHYPNLSLDEFVIMPNHLHAITILENTRRDRFINLSLQKPAKIHGLSEIIRGFKTWSARRVNELDKSLGVPLWQRSFYDHVIRDEKDLQRVREYIHDNPLKWEEDQENPQNLSNLTKS
jgi:REP element-mobilizing transposase RayT